MTGRLDTYGVDTCLGPGKAANGGGITSPQDSYLGGLQIVQRGDNVGVLVIVVVGELGSIPTLCCQHT